MEGRLRENTEWQVMGTHFFLFVLVIAAVAGFEGLCAETVDELLARGVQKLRAAQMDPEALVPAIKLLTQAETAAEASGDSGKCAEINAMLY